MSSSNILVNVQGTIRQAIIFAAGLGTRFKPWTDKHPKALALVNGKSLLQRNIEYLQQYGITDVIVNVHHFAGQVIDAIEKNKGWGSHIMISDEQDALLDTGGGLLKAKHFFTPGEKFVTCNADILTDFDINKLLHFHTEQKALISLAVTDRPTSRYLLFDENNRLCGWRNTTTGEEKGLILNYPARDSKRNTIYPKAYSCVAIFEYDIFRLMPFTGKFSLIDVYLALADSYPIMGYDHSGDRLVDVGRTESIDIAQHLFP